ncbi:hypothetical protein CLV67_113270 [Actinoplanes italicus]|uniref:Uncharacterized protein n=1 Tax=Actinoplanes italicus TaxID=113567 RepID=A0A2T0K631_9ACTN|nr:hypothetical protein CLV67_113270 [Actinoplanes italicus]
MGRVPANVSGDLVRVALMEARPAGLTTRQLITATELSAYQVQSGCGSCARSWPRRT